MSTPHNSADQGDIASKVLLPGDPLRAKFIAENFLENPVCYNEVRGMLGFTGTYKGKRISVQGTSLMTVSDHLVSGERCTTKERKTSFGDMINLALEIV